MIDRPVVFVVDDDEAVRDSLAALLESAGLPVVVFASGKVFLAAYDPRQRGCLLLDLDLPDMHGTEVLQALFAAGATRVEFGTPHGLTEETGLRLLGEVVLPALRRN